MRARLVAVVVAALLIGGCTSPTAGGSPQINDVTVFAAASLTDAFNKAGDEFATTKTRVRFIFNFGSSSTLATQITNGAPADVFASADEANMRKIVDAKLTEGAPAVFAGNRLAITVAAGNPKHVAALADLARPGLVVVLAAPTVPAGRYALDSLAKAGVKVTPASQELDVRSVLNKVALGEADAGIVYVTDVLSAGARVGSVAIPEQQQVVARYPIAVVNGAKGRQLARAFVEYLVGEDGQRLLAGFGFSRP
jgi:molybdate transport system substrate-binding protein